MTMVTYNLGGLNPAENEEKLSEFFELILAQNSGFIFLGFQEIVELKF